MTEQDKIKAGLDAIRKAVAFIKENPEQYDYSSNDVLDWAYYFLTGRYRESYSKPVMIWDLFEKETGLSLYFVNDIHFLNCSEELEDELESEDLDTLNDVNAVERVVKEIFEEYGYEF